jgi:hypothetical protein
MDGTELCYSENFSFANFRENSRFISHMNFFTVLAKKGYLMFLEQTLSFSWKSIRKRYVKLKEKTIFHVMNI